MSYALNKETATKTFYCNADKLPFFQFSSETLFSTEILENFTSLILFSQVSFIGYSSAYNQRHATNQTNATKQQGRNHLNHKRLADAFFTYHLLKYFKEFLKKDLTSI